MTPSVCPDCGARIDLDDQAETVSPVYRPNPGGMPYVDLVVRKAVVAACSGCEFCVEVRA